MSICSLESHKSHQRAGRGVERVGVMKMLSEVYCVNPMLTTATGSSTSSGVGIRLHGLV